MNQSEFDWALSMAVQNWAEWRSDFEYAGNDKSNLPVLRNPNRWAYFVWSYSVLRQLPAEAKAIGMGIREQLNDGDRLGDALADNNGQGIDDLGDWIATLHPALGRRRSLASKLAAFARPDRFVAWDRFAKSGAAALCNHSSNYRSYQDYLTDIDTIWGGPLGAQIRGRVASHPFTSVPVAEVRFQRRVLDHYLMIRGGRWRDRISGA